MFVRISEEHSVPLHLEQWLKCTFERRNGLTFSICLKNVWGRCNCELECSSCIWCFQVYMGTFIISWHLMIPSSASWFMWLI